MELIEKQDNKIIFRAEIDESLVNSIRRYVMEIPILAVDELEIHRNDSPLYDETIAHRVGLIPLKMEKTFKEGTEIKLKLKTDKEGSVYSGDMKGGAEVVYDKIPITLLHKGQEIEFGASAKIGRGSEHSKFNPGLIFYRNVSEISFDKGLSDELRKILPDVSIKDKGGKGVVMDNGVTEIADLIEGLANEKKKEITVDRKDELIITVESFGQIDSKEIFKKSIESLKKDLDEVVKVI
jgi:DNA-directed RNA polymerase subunit D